MRITPSSLEIQGFRSFEKKQVFYFADESGLGLITGANHVEDLGSNGSGKSSIWSALFWCLYGKSERGVQSPSLHNWKGEESLVVRFNFRLDGTEGNYIERTWKPVTRIVLSLRGSERQVSQEELEQWLGMGPEVFTQAVLVSQFGRSFLDFTPAEKQKFLMALMRSDRWDTYRDAAEHFCTRIAPEIQRGEAAIMGLDMRIKSMTQEYENYMQRARDWAADKDRRISALVDQMENIRAERGGFVASRDAIIAAYKPEDVNALQEERTKTDEKITKAQAEQDPLRLASSEAQGKLKVSQAQVTKLDQLAAAGYLCPTCGQAASPEHIQKERETHATDIKGLSSEITRIDGEKKKLNAKLTQLVAHGLSLKHRVDGVENDRKAHEKRVATLDSSITGLDIKLQTMEAQMASIGMETNQYENIVRERLEDIRQGNEEMERFRTKLQSIKAKEGIYEFWKKAFKEIQLFLLTEVTTQLEMAYNSSLSALGMPSWKLAVSVENETKSGTTQNKFTVQVLSPFNSSPVPLESWCGGETQRLRLATAFGTNDLVRQMTQVTWDLEIWDEPGQHLSQEGMSDLFKILRERAKVLGKQIFVTDHRTLQDEQFDFKRHVVKTATGSLIESG